jgi:hypothetical protein
MKIRGKLLLLNVLPVVGFAGILFATFNLLGNLRELNLTVRNGIDLKYEFMSLSDRGKDLLVTGNLERANASWAEQHKRFDAMFVSYVESSLVKKMFASKDLRSKFDSLTFLWGVANTQMGSFEKTGLRTSVWVG